MPAANGERWLFLQQFLREGRRVASVTPSSRALARALARDVDPAREQTIVELGAGTGTVSQQVCARMHARSRLVAIERNRELFGVLRRRVPGAVLGDVAELAAILDRCGVERIDLMLSGLPVPSLPRGVNAAVLERLAAEPDARFSQLTVMPWVYRHLYRRLFTEVEFRLVAANLPPGGVYHCRGLRTDFRHHLPGR